MKCPIHLDSYSYIMFVDASGDDGYKFKEKSSEGSSFSFVVSCFVTTPKNLEHNKSVLLDIKRSLFIKPEQEIKSTALKRHKNANLAYEALTALRGFSYSIIADKRLIKDAVPDDTKMFREMTILAQNDLSGITHVFPYCSLSQSNLLSENSRVLIVIDNMKKREMDSIKSILSEDSPEKYDLIFRDSKDKDFSLIQIADLMAGTIRSYYEDCLPLRQHNYFCRLCFTSLSHKKVKALASSHVIKCQNKHNKKLYKPYISNYMFNTVLRFHKHDLTETGLGEHLIILPVEQSANFMYIDCLILGNKMV